ncbi:MAG: hypothetical protein ACPIOQ_82505, partial [Promethearchaeia archaeon]
MYEPGHVALDGQCGCADGFRLFIVCGAPLQGRAVAVAIEFSIRFCLRSLSMGGILVLTSGCQSYQIVKLTI